MAFSSGTYTLPGAALNTGDTVSATENNTLRNDMASSFNLTWLRNGTAAATANIPMGGFKFTGLGNGIANGDSIAYGQSADVVLNGLTVGKGAGAVSTNTAVGASALSTNSTGANSTALGYQALKTSNADRNTAVGYLAATSTTGERNSVFGAYAMFTNAGGTQNAAFGDVSLYSNTTGNYNSGFGLGALGNNTTGSSNAAFGLQALLNNTTASNNTAVGYQAGYTNTTGIQKTCVGSLAGYSGTASTSSTCVGYYAGYSTTGTDNTLIGTGAGYLITSGAKNTVLGEYSGNQGGLDIRTASNYIVLSDGDGNPRAWWSNSGNITVPETYNNTTATAANMVVGASGFYARSTSALKYKQDVRDVEDFDISLLRPVRYKSKCEGDDQTKDHLGLIADEAAEAGFEELVSRGADGEVEGFQYERLTVVLLKAIQELKAEFDAYKATYP